MVLASAFLLGIKIIYTKRALAKVEPGKLILWHDVIGAALLGLYSVLVEDVTAGSFTGPAVAGLLYQGLVVAGLCFAIQARLLARHAASQISVFAFATPLFGIAFAVALRGDAPAGRLVLAGVCVAVGILLVNLSPRPAASATGRSSK